MFLINFFLIFNINFEISPFKESVKKISFLIEGEGCIYFQLDHKIERLKVYYSIDDSLNFKKLEEKNILFKGKGLTKKILYFKFLPEKILEPGELYGTLRILKEGNINFFIIEDKDFFIFGNNGKNISFIIEPEVAFPRLGDKVKINGKLFVEETKDSLFFIINTHKSLRKIDKFYLNSFTIDYKGDTVFLPSPILPDTYEFSFYLYLIPFEEERITYFEILLFDNKNLLKKEFFYFSTYEDYFGIFGGIAGRVLDAKGKPLQDIEIILDDGRKTRSDENGFFCFNMVYPGKHSLLVGNEEFFLEVPEGSFIFSKFYERKKRIKGKREFVFLYSIYPRFTGKRFDVKANVFCEGEIKENLILNLRINIKRNGFKDLFFYKRPYPKYPFLDGNMEPPPLFPFHIKIKYKNDYFNFGLFENEFGKTFGINTYKVLNSHFGINLKSGFVYGAYIKEEIKIYEWKKEYELENYPIIPGSEILYIVEKDNYGNIIRKPLLSRDNYSIDYKNGKIFLFSIPPSENQLYLLVEFKKAGEKENDIRKSNIFLSQDINLANTRTSIFFEKYPVYPERFNFIGVKEEVYLTNFIIKGGYAQRIEEIKNGKKGEADFIWFNKFTSLNLKYERKEKNSYFPSPGMENTDLEKGLMKLSTNSRINFPFFNISLYGTKIDTLRTYGFDTEAGYRMPNLSLAMGYGRFYGYEGEGYKTFASFSIKNYRALVSYSEFERNKLKKYGVSFSRNDLFLFNYEHFLDTLFYGNKYYLSSNLRLLKFLFLRPFFIYEKWRESPDYLIFNTFSISYFPNFKNEIEFEWRNNIEKKKSELYLNKRLNLKILKDLYLFTEWKYAHNYLYKKEFGFSYIPLFYPNFLFIFSAKEE